MLLKMLTRVIISWEQYEGNLLRLRENAQASGQTVARDVPATVPHCCKAWWCAAYAGAG